MKTSHAILFTGLFCSSPCIFAADWVSDWINSNGVGSSPTYYEGGNRSYLSGGNISIRSNNSVDHPFTISPPRVNTRGCGIDIFGGGLSYMDSDYLVEKFEGIIQNAEVVAFQLGVSALSDKLSTIIEGAENTSNFLNSLQLDECAIAKSAVTTVVNGNSSDAPNAILKEITQGQTLDLGIFKNATDSNETTESNDGMVDSGADIKKNIEGCPQPVQDLYEEGSLISNITSKYGMSDYANYIRGYIGDVVITYQGAANLPVGITKTFCSQNDNRTLDDFVFGNSYLAPALDDSEYGESLKCSASSSQSLIDFSEEKLSDLISILNDPEADMSDETSLLKFINNSPLPVRPLMEIAISNGVEQQVKDDLKYTLAYAYSYKVVNDLYRNTMTAIARSESARGANTVSDDEIEEAEEDDSTGIKATCNLKPFAMVDLQIDELKSRLTLLRQNISHVYMAHLQQVNATAKVIERVSNTNKTGM